MAQLHGLVNLTADNSEQLAELARQLNLPLFNSEQGFFLACPPMCESVLALVQTDQRLELRSYSTSGRQTIGAVYAEANSSDISRRIQAGKKQAFARSLGLHKRKHLCVLDATAGLGRDSMVMAGLGCHVTLLERNPVVHALLHNALERADKPNGATVQLLPCMQAKEYLEMQVAADATAFDVIYLDPMYPQKVRKALPKKEMQLLRLISGTDEDADTLLPLALRLSRRVVVKRAPHAGELAGVSPDHCVSGNRVRYDVYLSSHEDVYSHA